MRFNPDMQEEIACGRPINSRFTLSRQPDHGTSGHTCRHRYIKGLFARDGSMAVTGGTSFPCFMPLPPQFGHGSFSRNEILRVIPRCVSSRVSVISASTSSPRMRNPAPAPATKKILEEIAKTCGTSTRGKTVAKPLKSRAGVLPARRRRKIRTGLPVRSKLVVPFALVGIGQNFICLIYLSFYKICRQLIEPGSRQFHFEVLRPRCVSRNERQADGRFECAREFNPPVLRSLGPR